MFLLVTGAQALRAAVPPPAECGHWLVGTCATSAAALCGWFALGARYRRCNSGVDNSRLCAQTRGCVVLQGACSLGLGLATQLHLEGLCGAAHATLRTHRWLHYGVALWAATASAWLHQASQSPAMT
jgi:hypothetical protein